MRPKYGDVFNFERLLRVVFYTSNIDKLVQARLIFMRNGYQLYHYRSKQEPYDEDYELGTIGLLEQAVQQISGEFGRRSVIFVEDTSARIECLSDNRDYPGIRVKEWFSETSFEELDRQIALKGGNRRATVKSDIALRLPTLSRPVFFHGETHGTVADSPPVFEQSLQYPWLTPDTFNGWFVPDGSSKRLGEMEFEESLKYDFRAKSLGLLLERLEELDAAVNLSPRVHITRRSSEAVTGAENQLSLLPLDRRDILIVIGHRCAGKSTFADFLTGQGEGVFALEGSTLLRQIASERGEAINSAQDAEKFLADNGWNIVARRAAEYINREAAPLNIISGMRTVEELLALRKAFPQSKVVLVEADQRIRYERHIKRARVEEARTFREFQGVDEEQTKFGAMRVANDIADFVVRNDGDIAAYLRRTRELVDNLDLSIVSANHGSESFCSLRALQNLGKSSTCDEIAEETVRQGSPVRRYNTNCALKSVPEFASRLQKRGELLRYRLTARGQALLEYWEMESKEPL